MITLNKTMLVIFATVMFGILILLLGYLAHELWVQEEKFLSVIVMLTIMVGVAAIVCVWLSSGVVAW